MRFLTRFHLDGFIVAILAAVLIASLLPARGNFATSVDGIVHAAIALLFFLYGARLGPQETLTGLKNWRLQGTILLITFLVFPLIGVALSPILRPLLGDSLYLGVLFLTIVPSTVQSSIAFTSIAHGNIPGAIVAASFSNLLGVFATPLLVILLMTSSGGFSVDASSILDIVLQLLAPFILGQLSRPLIYRWLVAHAKLTKFVDRGSIVLIVYSAFSQGVVEGVWQKVRPPQIVGVFIVCMAILAFALWFTWWLSDRLNFSGEDHIAVQFCGSKKSLATGLPMAAVLFGSGSGTIILPLMIFHQIQLIVCSYLASRYGKEWENKHKTPSH